MSNTLFKDWEANRFMKTYRVWSLRHKQFGRVPGSSGLTQYSRYEFTHSDTNICFQKSNGEIECYTPDELISTQPQTFIVMANTSFRDKNQNPVYEGDILIDTSIEDDSPDAFQVIYLGQDRFNLYNRSTMPRSLNYSVNLKNYEVRGNIYEIQKIFPGGVAQVSLENRKTKVSFHFPRLTYEEAEKIRDDIIPLMRFGEGGTWEIRISYLDFSLIHEDWGTYLISLPESLITKIEEAQGR